MDRHQISKWTAPYENMFSGICGQRRPRSACASAQSDQDFHPPFTEALDVMYERMYEWGTKVRWYNAHAQDDLNLCVMRMFKGTFSLDVAQIVVLLRYILLYSRKVLNNHCLTEIIWPMLYYGLENKLQLYKWIVLTRSAMNVRFVVYRFICKYSRRGGHGT